MVALLVASAPGGASAQTPRPSLAPSPSAALTVGTSGARSLGDPFYPTLGNGGYDTLAIDLDVRWAAPDASHRSGEASVTTGLSLLATQDLAAFSLDLVTETADVSSVLVDGEPAAFVQVELDRKLVVTPTAPIPRGADFTVEVASTAVPGPVPRTGEDRTFGRTGTGVRPARVREGRGLIADGEGGMLLAAQPNGAHTLFPVNDHPLDKATVRVTLTAPPGMVGIATGALERLAVAPDGSLTTTWASDDPVASHVLSLGVGDRVLRAGPVADGVTYRSAIPSELEAAAPALLDELPALMAWLVEAIGLDHPFDTFGLLLYSGRPTEAILEGQTLALMPATVLSPLADRCAVLGTVVHEMAHQWFGDAASIARWDEKWLSEGHATYYEWRWLAEHGCLDRAPEPADDPDATARPRLDPDAALDTRMREAYREAAGVRGAFGPPSAIADPAAAYTAAIYDQGALALYALRLEVGDDVFGRVERAFLRRTSGAAATTDQLIKVASRVARRDLRPFLEAWLRGAGVPPMPRRPSWTTDVDRDTIAGRLGHAVGRPVGSTATSCSVTAISTDRARANPTATMGAGGTPVVRVTSTMKVTSAQSTRPIRSAALQGASGGTGTVRMTEPSGRSINTAIPQHQRSMSRQAAPCGAAPASV